MFAIHARSLACAAIAGCILFSGPGHADESLSKELVDRITRSKARLQEVEERISRQSRQYAEKLDDKQQTIKKLREEAAAVQRLTDEKLLGLDKLEERVNEWTTQSNYQKHLLTGYLEGVGAQSDADSAAGIDRLAPAVRRIESALTPGWRRQNIVTADGAIARAPVLVAGPVEVAYDQTAGKAGPVIRETGAEPRIEDVYRGSELEELRSLQQAGVGLLSFDPTLGNALRLRNSNDGLLDHLNKGGIWAVPIIFFGLLSFVISIIKGGQFVRLPKIDPTVIDRITSRPAAQSGGAAGIEEKLTPASRDVGEAQKRLIQIAASTPVSQQRDDLLVAYLMEYKHKLERFMGVVGTSAAVAPLLGLLGTVSGMISTFKMMTIFGSGDASTVSGGISEALVTTELGLIVAIPSLVVSALLTRKSKSYSHELENFAIKLSKAEFA